MEWKFEGNNNVIKDVTCRNIDRTTMNHKNQHKWASSFVR